MVIDNQLIPPLIQILAQGNFKTQKEAAWADFERVVDLLRVMFETPALWASNFSSAFRGMLTPRERLALPGARWRWTGGDATLQRAGSLDWGPDPDSPAGSDGKFYIMTDAAPLL